MYTFNLTFSQKNDLTLKEIQRLLDINSDNNLNISNFEKVEGYTDKFYYKKYGKGFLLFVNNGSKLFGQKYFLTGCWLSKVNGWFFKNDKTPLRLGAELVNKKVVWSDDIISSDSEDNSLDISDESDESDDNYNFSGNNNINLDIRDNILVRYGKGYLLYPKNGNNGDIKYLYNGWWIPRLGGWFFKKEYLDSLLMKGVSLK